LKGGGAGGGGEKEVVAHLCFRGQEPPAKEGSKGPQIAEKGGKKLTQVGGGALMVKVEKGRQKNLFLEGKKGKHIRILSQREKNGVKHARTEEGDPLDENQRGNTESRESSKGEKGSPFRRKN